jgi:hypothetical protein
MLRFVIFETHEAGSTCCWRGCGSKSVIMICKCATKKDAKFELTSLRVEYPARTYRLVGVYIHPKKAGTPLKQGGSFGEI